MSKVIRNHLRSNVVGYVALFIALGGTAYAANTVGSGDIIDNQVFSSDVRNDTLGGGGLAAVDLAPDSVGSSEVASNAIGGSEIATGAVGVGDVADNALRTFHILDNQIYSADVRDDTQVSGGLNASDLSSSSVGSSEIASGTIKNEIGDLGIHAQEGTPVSVPGGGTPQNGSYDTATATAQCPSGEELIAGSGKFPTVSSDAELFLSGVYLNYSSESVSVIGGNDSGTARNLVAVATCLGA
jgi:hypothetical protein